MDIKIDPKRIIYRPVVELSASIHSGELTSEAVVTTFMNRAREVNPVIGAIVQWNEKAIEEARELDLFFLKHGKTKGPLHGIPFTIKECFRVKGFYNTSGSTILKENIALNDATVLQRLKEAGGVLLGTTNLSEISYTYDGNNNLYPPTRNPYDINRTPGGSSAGEAAIIAAGGVPFGIGSDIGGSVRVPASWCGITSIKATQGRLPLTGSWPLIDTTVEAGISQTFLVAGPMARYVQDLELILQTVSGFDGHDWQSIIPNYTSRLKDVDLGSLRVGYVIEDDYCFQLVEDVRRAVLVVGETLKKKVQSVEEVKAPFSWKTLREFYFRSLWPDGGKMLKEISSREIPKSTNGILKTIELAQEFVPTETSIITTPIALNQARRDFFQIFKNYNVLIMPVADFPAENFEKTYQDKHYLDRMRWSQVLNAVGAPAVATGPIVVGSSGGGYDGLPVGVQVVVPPFQEHVALAVAKFLEENIPTVAGLHPVLE